MLSQFHDTKAIRWRGECRFYTACCVHKMAVNVTGSAAKRFRQTGHAE